MAADDDLDRLYAVDPADFTALRKELAAAAKKRGDVDAAKLIAAARRPTTAAWVVNTLVRTDDTVRDRLTDLAGELRAAHASMDGVRIRELSTAQRTLVDGLVRTAFTAAGQTQPTAALRDDVMGTLQAAIADPDVSSRLGRLSKAERWSGFGDFGSVSTVGAPKKQKQPRRVEHDEPAANLAAAARERVAAAQGDADAARQAHAAAEEALSTQSSALAAARRRYEKLLETLSAAEDDVNVADAHHADAAQAAREAAERLDAANSAVVEAESAFAALDS